MYYKRNWCSIQRTALISENELLGKYIDTVVVCNTLYYYINCLFFLLYDNIRRVYTIETFNLDTPIFLFSLKRMPHRRVLS
jgi:hypothetical protein